MKEALAVADTLTARTRRAIADALDKRRLNPRSWLLFVGPGVIVSIAYVDPGNFATNIQAGSRYGYTLLWVVLLANLIAMLFQGLSAKLGIVSGHNLAELCRKHFSPATVYLMWLVSEVAAMATDLAEFLGGAIGLSLLFQISLPAAMVATAIITYALLMVERYGFRPTEHVIGSFVAIIGLSYLAEMFIVPISWRSVVIHSVVAQIPNADALTIAVGIIGATVMPHAIYLHSALVKSRFTARNQRERRKLLLFSNREMICALTIAGLVNMAMVMMASSAFHHGHRDVGQIQTAYQTLRPLLGRAAAGIFLVSLLASGISSSAVGTMAGQVIMQSFVNFRIPIWIRRLVTMSPAFVVIAIGYNATQCLVLSQVVLSIVLPLPMIALVMFTRRADVMGEFANSRITNLAACASIAIVLALNLVLLFEAWSA